MSEHDRAVIVMAKRPRPGKTKTRLTPAMTPEDAAGLYEAMLLDTISILSVRDDCTPIIAVDEPESADWFAQAAPGVAQLLQGQGALGDRLNRVMTNAFDLGFSRVFAINSDGPDLPQSHLDDALRGLDHPETDLVFGPNADGGYYLIGWKTPWPEVVLDVTMSTPTVLQDTLAIAERLGARVHLGREWFDVDVPADLERFIQSLANTGLRSDRFLFEWEKREREADRWTP